MGQNLTAAVTQGIGLCFQGAQKWVPLLSRGPLGADFAARSIRPERRLVPGGFRQVLRPAELLVALGQRLPASKDQGRGWSGGGESEMTSCWHGTAFL